MKNRQQDLPSAVSGLLDRLRKRIRWYVWLEGLALAIIWLGLAFWIGLALDYLPVLVGAGEMPRWARTGLLIGVTSGLLYILYYWVFRRVFVRLANRSLALLLERYYPEFDDSLVTTVELSDQPHDSYQQSMLSQTEAEAVKRAPSVHLGRVFNRVPLVRNLAGATVAVASVLLFAVLAQQAFATWTSRLLLLSDETWPRRTYLEVLDFGEGQITVAEGSDLTVRVRADATRPTPPPDVCVIAYRLDGGEYGRVNMSRDGEPRDGHQYYRFDGKPFKGMLEDVDFDIIGFDFRISDLRVDVVKSPSVIDVEMACQLPEYTGRLARKQKWRPGASLPVGTRIDFTVQASKPLCEVTIEDLATGEKQLLEFPTDEETKEFQFDIASLREPLAIQLTLHDTDGIDSQQPYRLTIAALEDLAPTIDVTLNGIGTAITPDARLPLQGVVDDDYGVDRSWFQIADIDGEAVRKLEFPVGVQGQVQSVLDLRKQRSDEPETWELQTGAQVTLSVRAQDFYDLTDDPNIGQSDEYALDVVTSFELLALLEARELNLKRRFEQIISEMTTTRDSLLRLQSEMNPSSESQIVEPGDDNVPVDRLWSLRLLRAQRANQQGDKSRQEVVGVAESFSDIREELINNRVDTEERKRRLQEMIVQPLTVIGEEQFPRWQTQLIDLQAKLDKRENDPELLRRSVEDANAILLAMEDVLAKMIELETYNELVDLVRSIMQEQAELSEKTKEERKRQTRSLLEDL